MINDMGASVGEGDPSGLEESLVGVIMRKKEQKTIREGIVVAKRKGVSDEKSKQHDSPPNS